MHRETVTDPADDDATGPAEYDGLDEISRTCEALLELLGEWPSDGAGAPNGWTAATVPDFIGAMYSALQRHVERALREGADSNGDPWETVRRALRESRWDGWPPEERAAYVQGRMDAARAAAARAVPAPEGVTVEQTVEAWWRRSDYLHGAERDDAAAEALDWADGQVVDAMLGRDAEQAVRVVDDLLSADGADPEIVAYGPLERLLEERGQEVAGLVAGRCRDDVAWRAAVRACALSDQHPELAEFAG